MPVATCANPSTPVSTVSSLAPSNMNMNISGVQSGPYTKAQFQSTMEGSRTIKSSKEVEYLLRDYPAALELYRTGKYKVKVKSDTEVERVILVEKRTTKVTAAALPEPSTTTDDNQENNQTVPDLFNNSEEKKEVKKTEAGRRSRSRTQSRDRVAPTNDNNIVHTTISSIRMTSNTQPKVDHHRTPSRERDVSVTPPQKQLYNGRSQSRDSKNRTSYGKQINREYPKMMVPFVPKANNAVNLWQQQQPRFQQPYFSNPILQQQKRSSLYLPATFVPQQNPLYRQPYFYGQRPSVYPQQQAAFPPPTAKSVGKSVLYPTNNLASSSRSVSNSMGLPPSFRTFHPNQQPLAPFQPMYPSQVPYPINHHQWAKMSNEPISALTNNNKGPRPHPPVRPSNVQPQAVAVVEQNHRPRPQPLTNVAPSTENEREPTAPSKEAPSAVNSEKLTVRQLNESFLKADPSGRVPYSSLSNIIERFGITLTENDVVSAAKDLDYNVNEPISARRFIHILVKLGKITKSTQQQQAQPQPQRPPGSPSMLPEDREVTDIMTQRKATVNQPNQWH